MSETSPTSTLFPDQTLQTWLCPGIVALAGLGVAVASVLNLAKNPDFMVSFGGKKGTDYPERIQNVVEKKKT